MFRKDIIDSIGKTPLVQLRLDEHAVGSVYAKLELLNPFGMKDRVAMQAIKEAKDAGILRDEAPIIESSSGTMALGLALVGTYFGHEVHIVTDPRIDPITLAKLHALGCHVHVVQQMSSHGWQSARLERLAELLDRYPGAFWPRQYETPANPRAYTALAEELLDDLGRVDVLVAGVGSGGSLSGTARALRKSNPHLHVVGVDAVGSVIFGQPDRPKRLQGGLGNSLVPPNVDFSVIDEVHWLSDEEAFAGTLQLAAQQKIFAGNSSGSVYVVSRWLSYHVAESTRIVAIFPDRGDRYFNSIYNEEYRTEQGVNGLHLPEAPREVLASQTVTSWSYAHLKVGSQHGQALVYR